MSLNAAALKLLAAKGLSAADIVELAEALEADAPRSPAAIRQARYRQRGGGKIPEDMREAVFARDGYACLECGSGDYIQCDHIHPVSKGGETNLNNLQTLCRVCNARKKDRIRKRKSSGSSTEIPTEAAPPNDNILTPPVSPTKPNGLEPPKAKPAIKRPLPQSWQPQPIKPDGQAGMIVATWQAGRMERELSKFKDNALQNRRLCADWDAAWRNWIKKADEYDGQQRNLSLGRNQPSDGLSATTRAARDVFGVAASH